MVALVGAVIVGAIVAFASASSVSRASGTVLLGDTSIEAKLDSNPAGLAEAFQTTASASGSVATLTVYTDASSTASSLVAGLYADAGGHPGVLLGQGTINAPTPGAWNDISLVGATVVSGAAYWVALLAPAGKLAFRDRCCGGGSPVETSSQKTLTSLPASWTTGAAYKDGPFSAYGTAAVAPVLVVSPSSLSFNASAGGANPPSQSLGISNGGLGTIAWSATSSAPWLSITPASGSAPTTSTVSVATSGLSAGSYAGSITVTAPGAQNSPQTVNVTLSVTTPDTQAPTPPAGLSATVSGNSVSLSWVGSTDNVGVTAYNVYRSPTSGFAYSGGTLIGQTTSAAYTDTGLSPGTYYYVVAALDAAANLSQASNQSSATVAVAPPSSNLVGDQTIEARTDQNVAGSAEAFRSVASAAGTLNTLKVFVDPSSAATKLTAGIYADSGGHPGALLAQGTLNAPAAGNWNDVPVAPVSITSGAAYWIAILSPNGSGTLRFRERGGAGAAESSATTGSTALPATWSTGASYNDGPLSAWGAGAGPAGPPPDQVGQWSAPVAWPLVAVHMVLLPTGNVLAMDAWGDAPNTQRIWNPSNGTFIAVPYGANLFCSGHILLPDGRTLVVGGNVAADIGIKDATLFDASTNTWSKAADMSVARWYPTATVLGDGKVFVFAGDAIVDMGLPYSPPYFKEASQNSLPSIYNPVSNTWNDLTSSRLTTPLYPFMFQLSDGRIFDAGPDVTTRVMNPGTWNWSTVTTSPFDGGSAVMYLPDKIMKAGSYSNPDYYGANVFSATGRTAVIDMSQTTPAWRETAPMAFSRTFHNLTLLPDGTVLASGGMSTSDGVDLTKAVLPAELWDPTTETWKTVASLTTGREYHSTALLLPDGRVLMAGGGQLPGRATNINSAEIYSPAYLFKGTRPTITSAPSIVNYGSSFTVATPDAAGIQKVALIRTPSVTHGFDENQRYIPLSFTTGSGQLTVNAPSKGNVAPPGYYMLFILNGSGVPSVASFVRFPTPTEDTQPPTAPANLTATPGSNGTVSLAWTASTDNVGVTSYDVYRSTSPGFAPSVVNKVGTSTNTTFQDVGLAAGAYYYVVKAEDAAANLSAPSAQASATVQGTSPPPGTTFLVGDQAIEPKGDFNSAGLAEGFQTTSANTGTATQLSVYVDSTSTATTLTAGLYTDSGGHPGLLLSQGTLSAPVAGAWNDVSVPSTGVTSGAKYWIVFLSPNGAGTLRFRDRCCSGGAAAETSSQTALSILPAVWTTGAHYSDGPASGYAKGTIP